MSWTIQSLEIKGFKFFKESFSVCFDGRHVLLYGENGSGKSSIFWSLYTIFQSCLKTQVEAQKYFTHCHSQNLRNRFCSPADESGIVVTFVDDTGANTKRVEISNTKFPYSNAAEKSFMEKSMTSSDFMNYKFLQKLFDFPNSKENDVFGIFEKEVFKYLQLSKPLKCLDGNDINAMDAETWWLYIKSVPPKLPRNTGKNKNTINMGSPQYKAFTRLIREFNAEMKKSLTMLCTNTETIIERDFQNSFKLQFEYSDVSFNNIRQGFHKSRDGKIRLPRIILTAYMTEDSVIDRSSIRHPKSFFNEAKLTCAALALRMAILGTKPTSGPDYASVLVVDDLLISLDMGYRRRIIDAILRYREGRQLVILTHDRSFFKLVESEIVKKKEKDKWKMFEMYIDEDLSVPTPKLIEYSDLLYKAKMFYHRHEYAACANTLRRAYENVLKRLLPFKYKLTTKIDTLDNPCLSLNGLICNIGKFRTYYEDFPNLASNLSDDRQLILNPFSHDDLDTPLFKYELRESIEQLNLLAKVEKIKLVGADKVFVSEYKIEMTNGEYVAWAEFVFLEEWDKLVYNGACYHGNPQVRILSVSSNLGKTKTVVALNNLHHLVRSAVSLNKETAPTSINCILDAEGHRIT